MKPFEGFAILSEGKPRIKRLKGNHDHIAYQYLGGILKMSKENTLSSGKYVKKGFGTPHRVKKGFNKKMLFIAMTPKEYQSMASKA